MRTCQPVAKKIAKAVGMENFNVLQNNGRLAHQEVDHVCFYVQWVTVCKVYLTNTGGLQVHFHVVSRSGWSEERAGALLLNGWC